MISWVSANHDAAVFDFPDEIVLGRNDNRHLAFGLGEHRCIGSHFARGLAQVMVGDVLRRMPEYRIDLDGFRPYPPNPVMTGVATMPVTFTPGARWAAPSHRSDGDPLMPIPDAPELPRMRADRAAKLQGQMEAHGVDAMVLLTTAAVAYAANGSTGPACDAGRAALLRPVAVVVADDLCAVCVHPVPRRRPGRVARRPCASGRVSRSRHRRRGPAARFGDLIGNGARVAVDELTYPLADVLGGTEIVDAGPLLGAAKITKTPDELGCIRIAERINELAMVDVLAEAAPRCPPERPHRDVPSPHLRVGRVRRTASTRSGR